jgi:hypothetical protein
VGSAQDGGQAGTGKSAWIVVGTWSRFGRAEDGGQAGTGKSAWIVVGTWLGFGSAHDGGQAGTGKSAWRLGDTVRWWVFSGFLWWLNGPANTTAAAIKAIAIESFFMWCLLSADESGGHMLTRTTGEI